MARRKKTAKKTTRRRRVSGVGMTKGITGMLVNAGMATAGYVGASFLGKVLPVDNALAKAGVKIAGGIAVSKFIKGNAGASIGLGMAVAGVVDLGKQFAPNLISGIGEEPVLLISGVDTIGEIDQLGNIDTIGEIDQLGEIDSLGDISTLGGI